MSKRVRISFTLTVDDLTPADLLEAAGYRAVCAAENTVENETGRGAVGSRVRISLFANDFKKRSDIPF